MQVGFTGDKVREAATSPSSLLSPGSRVSGLGLLVCWG